jgi:hypothetical protein
VFRSCVFHTAHVFVRLSIPLSFVQTRSETHEDKVSMLGLDKAPGIAWSSLALLEAGL